MCYGDPFIENKGASNDSWKSVFQTNGIPIRCNHELKSPWDRVQALRAILPYSDFSKERVPKFHMALTRIYMPPEKASSVVTNAQFAYVHHPIYSHPCAAGEYLAVHDPHRRDRGITDEEKEQYEQPVRGVRVGGGSGAVHRGNIVRRDRDAPATGLPGGFTIVRGGLAVPTRTISRADTDTAERYQSRTRRLTGDGYSERDADRSGY
jgi:hypothetical protein